MPSRDDYKPKEIPLTGKLNKTGDDPAAIGTDFVDLKNIRYLEKHIQSIGGMSKINTTSVADDINTAYFFRKDSPTSEKHLLIHKNGNIYDNTAEPPAQADFGASIFADSAGAGSPRFNHAPGGKIVYSNGVDTCLWGGDEIKVNGFLDVSDSNSYQYNYLEHVSNNFTDANNLATIHRISGAVDANTILLMHLNSNLNDDGYPGGHTINGVNMAYNTSSFKFGTASGSFNGTNVAFTVDDAADLDFSGGSWTIDFWYKPNDTSSTQTIYHQQTDANNKFEIRVTPSVSSQNYEYMQLLISSGGSLVLSLSAYTGNYIDSQNWTHVAFVQNGDYYYLFINGLLRAIRNSAVRAANYTGTIQVGRTSSSTQYFDGLIDEFRISDTPRWTSTFSPPSAPYGYGDYLSTLYVGSTMKLSGINFYVVNANTNSGTPSVEYWNGQSWSKVSTLAGYGTPLGTVGKNAWTFDSTVDVAKLKSIDDAIMFWYKVTIPDLISGVTVYKVTAKAPVQHITDIWDGAPRIAASIQFNDSSKKQYIDITSSTQAENFDSNNEGTYGKLGSLEFGNDAVYIGSFERLMGFRVSFAAGFSNTNECSMSVYYWTGSYWQEVDGLKDETSDENISFNKSGTVSWDVPPFYNEFRRVLAGQPGRNFATRTSTSAPRGPISTVTNIATRIIGDAFRTISDRSISDIPTNPTSNIELYYYKVQWNGNGTTTKFPDESTTAGVRPFNINFIPSPREIRGYAFSLEFAQRLWLCGETEGESNAALASSLDTSQVFNGDDSFKQYFGDDTALVGGVSLYTRAANIISNTALFFKKTQTWALDISSDGSAIPRLISGSIGCISPYTIDAADVEISTNVYRRIAIWLSQRGVMVSDGSSPVEISGDISSLFDPMSSNYLTAAVLATCVGFIDVQRNEYNLIVPGVTAYVYDITKKKWFEAERNSLLDGGLIVYDANGASYPYGFGTNYVWQLETGYTFDGTDIDCVFRFGDIALDEGSIFSRTSIKSTKLVTKALTSSANNIEIYHYGDGTSTPYQFSDVSPVSTNRIVKETAPNSSTSHIFHSLEYTFSVNASATNFEPIFVGINFSRDRKEL